jgi:TatD family-associated radical SAM protein
MTIFYRLGNSLYVNITNACPCACVFCIRQSTDSVGDADSLWLEREPTVEEVKRAFDARDDLHDVDEVVFCGYGEPMVRAWDVLAIAKHIKEKTGLKVRINTNGLVKLLAPDFDVALLAGVVDSASVSLNADDAAEYVRIVQPVFGPAAYDAVVDFVKETKQYMDVTVTVMEDLGQARIDNCRQIAKTLGVPLRVRSYM